MGLASFYSFNRWPTSPVAFSLFPGEFQQPAKLVTEHQAGLLYLALSVSQISVVEPSLVLLPLKMWATKGEKKGKKSQSVLQSDKWENWVVLSGIQNSDNSVKFYRWTIWKGGGAVGEKHVCMCAHARVYTGVPPCELSEPPSLSFLLPRLWSHWQLILPGEGESVFIKGVASGQSIMLQEMALHPSGCGQRTLDSVQRTEKELWNRMRRR